MTLSLCPISGRLRDSPSLVAQLNMNDMTNKELTAELKEVKAKLAAYEDTGSLIPLSSYTRDFMARVKEHNKEVNDLLFIDCPKYWGMMKQAWSDLQTALPILALNK